MTVFDPTNRDVIGRLRRNSQRRCMVRAVLVAKRINDEWIRSLMK